MKKKVKIIPLIIAAIFLTAACFCLVNGIVAHKQKGNNFPVLYISDIETLGSMLEFQIVSGETLSVENGSYIGTAYDKYGGEDCYSVIITAPDDIREKIDKSLSIAGTHSIFLRGKIAEYDEDILKEDQQHLADYINEWYPLIGLTNTDEIIEEVFSLMPEYCIEVTDVISYKSNEPLWFAGFALLIFVAVIALLAAFLPAKKVVIIALIIVAVTVVSILFVLRGKIRTIASVKNVGDDLYVMRCYDDINADEYLNADISSVEELIDWLLNKVFMGVLPDNFDFSNFGCSAFTAETPEGGRIFGRNFDYSETGELLIYTAPKNGYASMGVADLKFFDVGKDQTYSSDSFMAKLIMLAAPYVVMDGVNEKGLGVGILTAQKHETHQISDDPDIMIFSVIRCILDKCANIDEAIELLDNVDIQTDFNESYHLFITDVSGRSVVVEWLDDEMVVNEEKACTNFVLDKGEYFQTGDGIDRYDKIMEKLTAEKDVLSKEDAMELLGEVKLEQKNFKTEWSCIYDLDNFEVDICVNRDYQKKYRFSRADFE